MELFSIIKDVVQIALLLFITFQTFHFMTKQEFLDFIAGFKTEIATVATKVTALEDKINSSPTEVDPDIVAAVKDIKADLDNLNTKADNNPAAGGDTTAQS